MRYALAVGSAACVYDDVARVTALLGKPAAIYACNDIGCELERLDFWCTLHPEHMKRWREMRAERGYPADYETIAPPKTEMAQHGVWLDQFDRHVSYVFPGMNSSGSSGLYVIKVALDDGHRRVVAAGIPMTSAGKHFKRLGEWEARENFVVGWKHALPHIKDTVRSMSGWTKELLGEPSREWMAQAA